MSLGASMQGFEDCAFSKQQLSCEQIRPEVEWIAPTSQDATPMAVYSADHTGPNTQSGGFQWGFFRVCRDANSESGV